jgi:hypothetical protein
MLKITKRPIALGLLLCLSAMAHTQDQFINVANLATKSGDIILSTASSKALISLKSGTREFKAVIGLFPIIPNPDIIDSLENQNKPLLLSVEGQFPFGNLDFLTTANNGTTGTINAILRMNDSIQNIPISISLNIRREPPVAANGTIPRFRPRLNMAFAIDPKTFGINNSPFNVNDVIFIEITNGIISRVY